MPPRLPSSSSAPALAAAQAPLPAAGAAAAAVGAGAGQQFRPVSGAPTTSGWAGVVQPQPASLGETGGKRRGVGGGEREGGKGGWSVKG